MRPLRLPAVVTVAILAALDLPSPRAAHAQTAAAESLFDQGRAALAAGDLDTACARFRASDKIDPAPGTRANLADCEERRGKVATAWEAYRAALRALPPGDSRATVIQERLAKLERRLPKLSLTLAPGSPKDVVVREGETTLGTTGAFDVPLPLDPGVHHLTVVAPGRAPRSVDVTLVEAKTTTLVVEAGPPDGAAAPAPGAPSAEPGAPQERASVGPFIVGGIGVVGLVVGAVMGGIVLHKKGVVGANCTDGPPPTCRNQEGLDAASTIRTLGPATTVGLVIGAAGVAAGGIWLGVSRSGRSSAKIGVAPVHAGAVWRVEGAW